jgi:hypothetical protein
MSATRRWGVDPRWEMHWVILEGAVILLRISAVRISHRAQDSCARFFIVCILRDKNPTKPSAQSSNVIFWSLGYGNF